MKKALKAKWVKALRSGEFKRGTGGLTNHKNGAATTYCCLGVLCAISPAVATRVGPERKNAWKELGFLSASALRYAGIDPDTQCELASMNDGPKGSFKRIATYIEKNL